MGDKREQTRILTASAKRKNTMGAKCGKRVEAKLVPHVMGTSGPVAQLLHPWKVKRDDVRFMCKVLKEVDKQLSLQTSGVKLVVSGGGLIEIYHEKTYSPREGKSEATLDELKNLVQDKMQQVAVALKDSKRDYIIGVDVCDAKQIGRGQFAVVISAGKISDIAWKSYPSGGETKGLAGFGTEKGRSSPRIVKSALGKAILLVCHDSQAYNHRNIASVKRASTITNRGRVIRNMTKQIQNEAPKWAFSLIHKIDKLGSVKPFRTSYTQIHRDHAVPAVVGAFGYGQNVQTELPKLANKLQFPGGKACVTIILETS